ncbi:MAG: SET domain-containing protein-lysine N-methyltransferase [Terriglobales bacterium]|jgi:uncharacterized protein
MAETPVVIALTPEQRSIIRQASGGDVAELSVEQMVANSGWLFSAGGEKLWRLKSAGPKSDRAQHQERKPRINPRLARFRLNIGKSRIHRWGVFAVERIPAWSDVIEYVGEIVDPRECCRRARNSQETYAIVLDGVRIIDGSVGGSGAEIINHSCNPNMRYRLVGDHVYCQSIRIIEPGEELTADYRFRSEGPETPCRCGSPNCRGTINLIEATKAEP